MRRLLNEVGSIILALVLALIVWTVAINEENPLIRGPWSEPIPIEILNQPDGTLIVGEMVTEVRLTLRAPQRSWEDLRRESFRAWVDLSSAEIGMNQMEVHVECSDKNVEIVERHPSTITVRLERLKQIVLPVRVDILDSPPFGFEIKNDEVTVSPEQVTVSGPEQLVDQVAQVVADVYLRGASETIERKTSIYARNSAGETLNVTLKPNTVSVKVPIVQRRGFRNLSVRVVWAGQPALGYRISNVSVDPTIVMAIGDPAIIEELPGYLETVPVKVDGATNDVVERVALVLPEGVSIIGTQSVQVTISVTPIQSSLTVQRRVVSQGLSLDLMAVPSPDMVDVILSGPLPKLDALRPEDVQVIVNLFGLDVGSYQVEPDVVAPEGITVESVVPKKIQVVISRKPTATPTATSTATPTATATATATPTPTATATPTPEEAIFFMITITPAVNLTPSITIETPRPIITPTTSAGSSSSVE